MKRKETFYSKYGKRWLDLMLTIPGFVLITPLLVRAQLGRPVLFTQVQPRLHGRPLKMSKSLTGSLGMSSPRSLLLAILRWSPRHRTRNILPSKTYAAMAAGCAILALTVPNSHLAQLITAAAAKVH